MLCEDQASPLEGDTFVPAEVTPDQPTARGPANMSDGPFEVS